LDIHNSLSVILPYSVFLVILRLETLFFPMISTNTKSQGDEAANQFSKLIDAVVRLLIIEAKNGKGNLKSRIDQISSHHPFVDWPVVYLPTEGTALFVGDTHGDSLAVSSVISKERFVEQVSSKNPMYLVVMGDFADRGKEDVKNVQLLLRLKQQFPLHVHLLRGNHEDLSLGQSFGLLSSCINSFGYERGQEIFNDLNDLYERLPIAVVCGNGVVAVHGGVPVSPIGSLKQLADEENMEEMRWNDPTEQIDNFIFNYQRGSHYLFGRSVFGNFMEAIGGKVLVRSHEYVSQGYKFMFDNRLVTIFSNGGTSPESGYQDFILAPKYIKVDLAKPIDHWTRQQIFDIPYPA